MPLTQQQVYHATDKRTQRDVAIKILPLSRQNEAEIVTYEREVSVLQAGSTSPYVVNLIETYMFDSEVWIVMEYCGAGALESILIDSAGRPQPLSEDEAAAVIKMLLLGLLHLHQRRKIHRDVKGANVLVTARGECKYVNRTKLNEKNIMAFSELQVQYTSVFFQFIVKSVSLSKLCSHTLCMLLSRLALLGSPTLA